MPQLQCINIFPRENSVKRHLSLTEEVLIKLKKSGKVIIQITKAYGGLFSSSKDNALPGTQLQVWDSK